MSLPEPVNTNSKFPETGRVVKQVETNHTHAFTFPLPPGIADYLSCSLKQISGHEHWL